MDGWMDGSIGSHWFGKHLDGYTPLLYGSITEGH